MSFIAMGVFAVVSIGTTMQAQEAQAKAADRARAAQIAGAKLSFAGTEASANMMKSVNREQTNNAINEALRAGAAQNQDVRDEVQRVESSVQASSEGLTSGRSAGRQMMSVQIKGNQALMDSKSDTANMISKLTDEQDQQTNEINTKLFNDYQSMVNVLQNPGAVYQGTTGELLSAGMSGASAGASVGSAATAYNKST